MLLSVIVCTYNRSKYIYRCLSLLARNNYTGRWELVVVDNNSTDDTAAECKRFAADFPTAPYRYVLERQQGLSYARNRGIKEAKGEWLMFLDDDAFVKDTYLNNLEGHIKSADFDAFGGRITPLFEDGEPAWYSRWAMGFVSAIDMGDSPLLFKRGTFPIGANMGISRRALDLVGGFNTALGRSEDKLLAGEEKDIFNRIHAAGMRIMYLPDITVEHCIPARRATDEFIARLGEGVGISEKRRTLSVGKAQYAARLMTEFVKWCGTAVIALYYALRCQWPKGRILLLFRKNVTKGLI